MSYVRKSLPDDAHLKGKRIVCQEISPRDGRLPKTRKYAFAYDLSCFAPYIADGETLDPFVPFALLDLSILRSGSLDGLLVG